MADATRSSCSQLGPLGLCFCADDFSPSQVAVVLFAATIGILTILSVVYCIVRVLLSLFVVPGKSVRPHFHSETCSLPPNIYQSRH